jgi:hypothetical protein
MTRNGGDENGSEALKRSGVCVSDWTFYRGHADDFCVTFVPYHSGAYPNIRRA